MSVATGSTVKHRTSSERLAIHGGVPVRDTLLPFNAPQIGPDEIAEVVDTLSSGWLTTGPKTKRFETEFAEYVGARYAVALNSCTAGLHLSLVVLSIGPGDEVILPALTFGATANVVEHVGARPVLADVDPLTFCLDPGAVAEALTPRTRAVIPVHYAGLPCDLAGLGRVVAGTNVQLIEDAAHAVGARYEGRRIGSWSTLTNFSFYANKNLSTAEGGMVTTDDADLEEQLRVYSLHGLSRDAWRRYHVKSYQPPEIILPGFKYNMTDVQASLGLHQLAKQERFLARREEIAAYYDEAFRALDGLVTTQARPHDAATRHALHFYPLLLRLERLRATRDEILNALLAENIGVSMHFQPLHQMPYYRDKYGYVPESLPHAARIGRAEVSLPMQPQMAEHDRQDVVDAVMRVLNFYRV
jgi:dTDP-4-amino-4,6-dideoxygalactose transaminase